MNMYLVQPYTPIESGKFVGLGKQLPSMALKNSRLILFLKPLMEAISLIFTRILLPVLAP